MKQDQNLKMVEKLVKKSDYDTGTKKVATFSQFLHSSLPQITKP